MQNIPIKSDLGKRIRHAFVAQDGFELLVFDYSQIELRIAAFLSGDKKLIDIFKEGRDVHNSVAAEVFEVSPDKVTPNMRRQAKVINFGILYGMGVNALRANIGTDRKTAKKFYDDYFEKFEGLADYLEKVKRETKKNGYTKTYFGRKRFFPGIKSKLPHVRAQAERMAMNAPIQGTQADVIKYAMVKIDDHLNKKNLNEKVKLILQVHDELVYEVKKETSKDAAEEIKKTMESIISPKDIHGIKLLSDARKGPDWGELDEISF